MQPANPLLPQGEEVGDAARKTATATGGGGRGTQPANPLQSQGEVVGACSPQTRYSHRVRWSGHAAHKPATATG